MAHAQRFGPVGLLLQCVACAGAIDGVSQVGAAQAPPPSGGTSEPAQGGDQGPTGPASGGARTPEAGGAAGAPGGPPTGARPADPSGRIDPAACAPPPARLWKLSPEQYGRTVEAAFGADVQLGVRLHRTLADTPSGFGNSAEALTMTGPHVEQLYGNAAAVATRVAATFTCPAGGDPGCARKAIADLGRRAFRRPLAPDEQERYEAFFTRMSAGREPVVAFHYVVTAMLLAPQFLYRTELGADAAAARITLTPYERASALSYLIANGPPDAELSAAADSGRLANGAEVIAQAKRLLARPESSEGVAQFFREYIGFAEVAQAQKDGNLFGFFNTGVKAALERETRLFIEHVLWRDDGRLPTLLTADWSVLSKDLAGIYGVTIPGKDAPFAKMALPAGQRSGLLTHASLLAQLGTFTDSDPVQRGRFVRGVLMCEEPPPPPPNVNAAFPPPNKMLTTRERIVRHSQDPTCSPCHKLLDPIGFAFESLDAVGRHRATEAGKPVDTRGLVVGLDGADVPVANVGELGRALAGSRAVRRCVTTRLYEYAVGRAGAAADACAIDALARRMDDSGGDLRAVVLDLVASEAFSTRAAAPAAGAER
jgi:hypothetical protein